MKDISWFGWLMIGWCVYCIMQGSVYIARYVFSGDKKNEEPPCPQ